MKTKKIATLAITVLAVAIFATAAYCFLGGADPSRNMGNYRSFSFYADRPGNAAAAWMQPGASPPNPWDEFWFDYSGNFNLPGGFDTPGPVTIGTTYLTGDTLAEFTADAALSKKVCLTGPITISSNVSTTCALNVLPWATISAATWSSAGAALTTNSTTNAITITSDADYADLVVGSPITANGVTWYVTALNGGSSGAKTVTLSGPGVNWYNGGTGYSFTSQWVLTVNGPFMAGIYQCFNCPVMFGSQSTDKVYVDWFGTNTTPGKTDMGVAINAAANSARQYAIPVKFGRADSYYTTVSLNFTDTNSLLPTNPTAPSWVIEGTVAGTTATYIKANLTNAYPVLDLAHDYAPTVKNLVIYGVPGGLQTCGILIAGSDTYACYHPMLGPNLSTSGSFSVAGVTDIGSDEFSTIGHVGLMGPIGLLISNDPSVENSSIVSEYGGNLTKAIGGMTRIDLNSNCDIMGYGGDPSGYNAALELDDLTGEVNMIDMYLSAVTYNGSSGTTAIRFDDTLGVSPTNMATYIGSRFENQTSASSSVTFLYLDNSNGLSGSLFSGEAFAESSTNSTVFYLKSGSVKDSIIHLRDSGTFAVSNGCHFVQSAGSGNIGNSDVWELNGNGTPGPVAAGTDEALFKHDVIHINNLQSAGETAWAPAVAFGNTIYTGQGPWSENYCSGSAILVDGTVTVSAPCIWSGGHIMLSHSGGGTVANYGFLYPASVTQGSGFTINSTNSSDTDNVYWSEQ